MNAPDKPVVLKLVLQPDLSRGFTVYCEELPHLEASGRTLPEAMRNFRDAFTRNDRNLRWQLQPASFR